MNNPHTKSECCENCWVHPDSQLKRQCNRTCPCHSVEKESWENRLAVVRARGKNDAKFQPVLYIDNDIVKETQTLISFIHNLLAADRQAIRERTVQEVVEFIKSKSEQVTPHLWYVSEACFEDAPRFFSDDKEELDTEQSTP